jgi:multiple RNA-binding domain-containing protein 1
MHLDGARYPHALCHATVPSTLDTMGDIATSRIFVRGLPPTFTDAEFRKHFARDGEITDAKIFPNRRIGYVGFKTPEEAQKAVKYFNKTFIRMSRINVELARPPVQQGNSHQQVTPAHTDHAGDAVDKNETSKRKRNEGALEKEDPKLKEFLEVMTPASKKKKKAWEAGVADQSAQNAQEEEQDEWNGIDEGASDEEYELVPRKSKRSAGAAPDFAEGSSDVPHEPDPGNDRQPEHWNDTTVNSVITDTPPGMNVNVSDSDWARSRTSRLLGLLDDDEEEDTGTGAATAAQQSGEDDSEEESPKARPTLPKMGEAASSLPSPPADAPLEEESKPEVNDNPNLVRTSMRLFVRNLPYNAKAADLESEFASFGHLEEVSKVLNFLLPLLQG